MAVIATNADTAKTDEPTGMVEGVTPMVSTDAAFDIIVGAGTGTGTTRGAKMSQQQLHPQHKKKKKKKLLSGKSHHLMLQP